MKLYELGIYHHGCWNTDSIVEFPEIASMEWGGRCSHEKANSSVWRIVAPDNEHVNRYVQFLKSQENVLQAAPLMKSNGNALISIRWKAEKTSYGSIMKSGCMYHSNTYSKDGYETYSIFTDDPEKIRKLMDELEEIGEIRIFKIKNTEKSASLDNRFGLTPKQMNALLFAISQGYYSWPKKLNLEELAGKSGVKRRTIQEHLRKAENKVFSALQGELAKE